MAVISITIVESSTQIVSGIPESVSIETNIESNIFYTLDGSDPTIYSNIYIDKLKLPTNKPILTLKIFATNGIDNSLIITNTYKTDSSNKNVRFAHSGTNLPQTNPTFVNDLPFGSNNNQTQQIFTGTSSSGLNINNPDLIQVSTGFDGSGNPISFTNGQFVGIPSPNFEVVFSETNAQGEIGHGIGTLPKFSIIPTQPEPEESDTSWQFFDPRALVVIQDLTKEQDPGIPPIINRQHFSVENVNVVRHGNQYYNTGMSAPPTTGSFIRQYYNPSNNTITYYYFDSSQNRWIISTTPFTPSNNQYNYSSNMVFGKSKHVYTWLTFKNSYLY